MPIKTKTCSALTCVTSWGTFLMIRHSTPVLRATPDMPPLPCLCPSPPHFRGTQRSFATRRLLPTLTGT